MTTSTPTVPEGDPSAGVLSLHRSVPDPPFHSWLLRQIKNVRGAVLLVITLVISVYNSSIAVRLAMSTQEQRRHLLYGLHGTQALIILIVVAFIAFGRRPRIFHRNPRGSAAVEQFWNWWPMLWVAWLILYGSLAASGVLGIKQEDERVTVFFHLINNFSTLLLLRFYHILAQPTISDQHPAEGDILPAVGTEMQRANPQGIINKHSGTYVSSGSSRFVFWISLVIVALGIEAAIAWSSHTGTNVLSDLPTEDIIFVFGILYGVLAAVATALLVGQLDSPLLGVPPYAIVILFVYAAIQPMFDIVMAGAEETSVVRVAAVSGIVTMALIGKLCLFVVVQWLALSDRLFYFLVQNYTLYNRVAHHRSEYISARVSDESA